MVEDFLKHFVLEHRDTFIVAEHNQIVARLDFVLLTGFLGDDDLSTLAHFHYAENEFSIVCFHND